MSEERLKFYRITDEYLKFLRSIERKVQLNYPNRAKPHVGILLNLGLHQYFAPLSSWDEQKYGRIKKWNKTIFKVVDPDNEENKLAVIHVNNMIPIIQTEIVPMDFNKEEEKYRSLLVKEYRFVIKNEVAIRQRAQDLYHAVKKGDKFYSDLSCDFATLEIEYLKFRK